MKTLHELEDALWDAASVILVDILPEPKSQIRWKYPTNGAPDWKISDNVLFLNLSEKVDAYAQQRDSTFSTVNGTVIRSAMRTRVWDLTCSAYGPNSYDIVNTLKNGFFIWEAEAPLWKKDIHLVPDLPICRQMMEIFAGQWWERWDLDLTFNEKYIAEDDVGHIDSAQIFVSKSI